jgi:hypothetical protein
MSIEGAPRAKEIWSGMAGDVSEDTWRGAETSAAHQCAEVAGEAPPVGVQVPPGDSDDSVSGEREQAVTLSVRVEAGRCFVGGPAVELDDEAGVAPEAIGFDPAAGFELDRRVEFGR